MSSITSNSNKLHPEEKLKLIPSDRGQLQETTSTNLNLNIQQPNSIINSNSKKNTIKLSQIYSQDHVQQFTPLKPGSMIPSDGRNTNNTNSNNTNIKDFQNEIGSSKINSSKLKRANGINGQSINYRTRSTMGQNELKKQLKIKQIKLYKKIYIAFKYLLNQTESRRYKRLQDKHFLMINDVATLDFIQKQMYLKKHQKRSIIQKWKFFAGKASQKCLRVVDRIWPKVQHPQKLIIQITAWTEVITIILILLLFTFYLFYTYEKYQLQQTLLKGLGQAVFLICPLFRLNCGYYKAGKFIDNRHQIIIRYIKSYLFFDLCGCLAIFYTQIYAPQTWVEKLFVLPIFLKFKTLKSLVGDLQEKMNLTGTSVYIWQMLKLFVITWILCHVIGTMYHLLALAEHHFLGYSDTWQHQKGIFDEEWYVRYIESFYWAQSTIMLIGSKGETMPETVFSCLTIFMTVGYFSVILSSVEMVMNDMNAKNKKHRKDEESLNMFFKHNNQIRNETQSLVLNYLKYYYMGHKDMSVNENVNHIISKFPQNIQDKIKMDRYSFFVDKFSFLKNNFSYHTLDAIPDIIQEEYYMPNQVIFKSSDSLQVKKLYLIVKGSVIIYNEYCDIQKMKQGNFFCENQFFHDLKHTYSVRSDQFTTVLSIDRCKFKQILKKNEKDLETFQEIQHSFKVFNKSGKIRQSCYNCQESHLDIDCNLIHFNPNHSNIIRKYNFYQDQKDRYKDYTRKKKHVHSFQLLQELDRLSIRLIRADDLKSQIKKIQKQQQYSLHNYSKVNQFGHAKGHHLNSNNTMNSSESDDEYIMSNSQRSSSRSSSSDNYSDSDSSSSSDMSSPSSQSSQDNNNYNNKKISNQNSYISERQQEHEHSSNGLNNSIDMQIKLDTQQEKQQNIPKNNFNLDLEPLQQQQQQNSVKFNTQQDQGIDVVLDDDNQNLSTQQNEMIIMSSDNEDTDRQKLQFSVNNNEYISQPVRNNLVSNMESSSRGPSNLNSRQQIPLNSEFQSQQQSKKQSTQQSQENVSPTKLRKRNKKKTKKVTQKYSIKSILNDKGMFSNLLQNNIQQQQQQFNINQNKRKSKKYYTSNQQSQNMLQNMNIPTHYSMQLQQQQNIVNQLQQYQQQQQQQQQQPLLLKKMTSSFGFNKNMLMSNSQKKLSQLFLNSFHSIPSSQQLKKHNSETHHGHHPHHHHHHQHHNPQTTKEKQQLQAVKNFAKQLQKSSNFNLDQFILTQNVKRQFIDCDEGYRQFFCEFDKQRDFHYFLIHNNLSICIKNYYRYMKKIKKNNNNNITNGGNNNNNNLSHMNTLKSIKSKPHSTSNVDNNNLNPNELQNFRSKIYSHKV